MLGHIEAERLELRGELGRRLVLMEGQLGVAVQVLVEGIEGRVERVEAGQGRPW